MILVKAYIKHTPEILIPGIYLRDKYLIFKVFKYNQNQLIVCYGTADSYTMAKHLVNDPNYITATVVSGWLDYYKRYPSIKELFVKHKLVHPSWIP